MLNIEVVINVADQLLLREKLMTIRDDGDLAAWDNNDCGASD
jgi:hypothetical protein